MSASRSTNRFNCSIPPHASRRRMSSIPQTKQEKQLITVGDPLLFVQLPQVIKNNPAEIAASKRGPNRTVQEVLLRGIATPAEQLVVLPGGLAKHRVWPDVVP